MKIKHLFLAILAGSSLIACSNDDDNSVPENEIKSVSVSLAGLNTKATGPTEIATSETKDVNSVLINLTDVNGTVVETKTVAKDAAENSDWDKLTDPAKGLKFINITQNVSKVFVYGNPGTAIISNTISTNIAAQQGTEVLYYGVDEDLTPVQTEPINPDPASGKTYTANVTIAPMVARMQIMSISFQNSGETQFSRVINNVNRTATVSWTGFTGTVKGIYMNSFYYTFLKGGDLTSTLTLMKNSTFQGHIQNGQWIFETPAMDAAEFASYSNFQNNAYVDLPLTPPAGQCYAFNFFPSADVPTLHLDLANISIEGLESTDEEVFNPALATGERFSNIVKYYLPGNIPMTAADFKAGTLYNMDIELVPILDNDLSNIQYNVLVHVTVAPWTEQTIIPGFNVEQ